MCKGRQNLSHHLRNLRELEREPTWQSPHLVLSTSLPAYMLRHACFCFYRVMSAYQSVLVSELRTMRSLFRESAPVLNMLLPTAPALN